MNSASPDSRVLPDCSAACQVIRAAGSEAEVMRAVREYMDSFEPGTIAAIPVSLLTLQINSAREVAAAAVELARHEAMMTHEAPEAAMVKDVAMVLSTAAMRLAVLSTDPGRPRP